MDSYSLKSVFDLPQPFQSCFSFRYFNSPQCECFPTCYHSDVNMVISAPTGSGKTEGRFIHVKGSLKTIYIAPSKALVQEKVCDWNQKFGPWGICCLELTGDVESYTPRNINEADIILTTPEMSGRAGRPPFDDTGLIIIMTRRETVHLYENLLSGCEVVESQLLSCVTEHLLAEIVQLMVSDIAKAIEWMKCSYLYVIMKRNPENYAIKKGISDDCLEKHVQEICVQKVNELSQYQMVWVDEDGFFLRSLDPGRLMTKYYLRFDTMKQIMRTPESCSLEDALCVVCFAEEIAWMQLRCNEKKILNDINEDKDGRLRFHILGDKEGEPIVKEDKLKIITEKTVFDHIREKGHEVVVLDDDETKVPEQTGVNFPTDLNAHTIAESSDNMRSVVDTGAANFGTTPSSFHFSNRLRLIVTTVILLCLALAASTSAQDTQFDYYMVVLMWPPTVEMKGLDRFVMHGLWPQRHENPQPYKCKHKDFLEQKDVRGSLTKMETCCPNIESGGNMFFWGHEWYAHGTCSNLDKRGYFNLAFNLYKDNNIGRIFDVNFIRPGAISRSAEMVRALKVHTEGKEVQLICDNDGKLKEVILCVEKHEPFNHVNCPVKVHCPEFVNYPPVIANEEL